MTPSPIVSIRNYYLFLKSQNYLRSLPSLPTFDQSILHAALHRIFHGLIMVGYALIGRMRPVPWRHPLPIGNFPAHSFISSLQPCYRTRLDDVVAAMAGSLSTSTDKIADYSHYSRRGCAMQLPISINVIISRMEDRRSAG